MAEGKIFVGRKAELEKFKEVLKNPKGQAVLVIGQAGMGKTWLVNKMTEIAENHPELKCGWVRYEPTSNDSVDALSAMRLAEHVLAAEGKVAFVDAFVNECGKALMNLGLLDNFISLSKRALGMVEKDSKEETTVTSNLGLVYKTRGELDKSEEMYLKSLEISESRGMLELTANQNSNLGSIYEQRGDIVKAREYWEKALELYKRIGMPHMVENVQGLIEGIDTE